MAEKTTSSNKFNVNKLLISAFVRGVLSPLLNSPRLMWTSLDRIVAFSLTHKAGLPIVDRQKRDSLSPTIDIISFTEDIDR